MTFDATAEEALIAAVRTIAAEEILPRFRALEPSDIASKSRPDDLVTVADREAERRLTEVAKDILPGVVVVGEEAVADDPALRGAIAEADTCLIVDPVDGTWNFAHGLSVFGVILALTHKGRTQWGMIYDPIGDDWEVARAGQGARMVRASGRDTPLRYDDRPTAAIGDTAGYVHSFLTTGEDRRRLFEILPKFRRTDALRCSAHEYRLLAQGGVDFCMSSILNPWDHAAGALIVTEAGGVARMMDGSEYAPTKTTGRLLTARSEGTWQAVAEVLGA